MKQRLVVASNNSAKTRELQAVFAEFGVEVVNYRALIEEKIFPPETTDDQYENALGKARFIQQFLPQEWLLADDTGAYFAAFPDQFGLTIARDFKAQGLQTVAEENAYLLNLYTPDMDRGAYLEAMFILLKPDGTVFKSVGKGGVKLAQADRGTYSQGFDCLFEAENGLTFAEMPMSQRILYSHRGRAAKALLAQLEAKHGTNYHA